MPNQLEAKAALKILKPAREVYEAIIDPAKMSQYFIASSTGRMTEGSTLTWKFPEFDMKFPVQILKTDPEQVISFSWGSPDGSSTTVDIRLEKLKPDETLVRITEGYKENSDAGINWMRGNTEGWANFLACLKAYLEYGINLRKGAFDPSQMPQE